MASYVATAPRLLTLSAIISGTKGGVSSKEGNRNSTISIAAKQLST